MTPTRSSLSLPSFQSQSTLQSMSSQRVADRLESSGSRTSTSNDFSRDLRSLSANTSQSNLPTPIITHRKPLPLDATLENHQRWVWDCAFSADSAYLVTVCSDHYARLWDLSTPEVIRQYSGHHRGAVCVALNDYSGPGA